MPSSYLTEEPLERTDHYIFGLIPARGGSKGIPGKNVRPLAGKPLVQYTCEAARGSRLLSRTIVSTDCAEIAGAASNSRIEVPFLRPAELATDTTPTVDVIHHAIEWMELNEGKGPDIVVLLQPTAPLRQSHHIDEALHLLANGDYDSVVSVAPIPQHYNPHWQFVVEDGQLQVFTGEPLGGIVTRRQELGATYTRNGAIYGFHRKVLEETGSIYGNRCAAYLMPAELSINLDTMDDWHALEAYMRSVESSNAAA